VSASDHIKQGLSLAAAGRHGSAIAEYRKAIAIDPKEAIDQKNYQATAHYNLGVILCLLGKRDEGRTTIEQACPDPGLAHAFFANALRRVGKMDEAVGAARQAVQLKPDSDWTHYNLGWALMGQKNWDGAITAYREAVRLNPVNAAALGELGISLEEKGLYEEAIPEYQKAVALLPRAARYHNNLGWCLYSTGKTDEAIACFRKAVELNPNFFIAHNNLGDALKDKEELEEAIACYKKADALNPAASWARVRLLTAQRLAAARDKFPAFQDGTYKPATSDERAAMAKWCTLKKLYHAAASLWAAALAEDAKLADDLKAAHRWNAACNAALAAAGKGGDAAQLDEKERVRLRKQALDWLRANLVLRQKQLETDNPTDRAAARAAVGEWLKDNDLAGIRDASALAKLPAEEQLAFTQLWADVAEFLKKADEQAKRPPGK
jgi:tetratricopeptide (TPR) repeat protein